MIEVHQAIKNPDDCHLLANHPGDSHHIWAPLKAIRNLQEILANVDSKVESPM